VINPQLVRRPVAGHRSRLHRRSQRQWPRRERADTPWDLFI